ncbi:MAG TPA: hypothetical protein VKR83_15415 [Ktedonobacteraceae bacterium]|nr:hypothetical protein [Ktedonobacteraceae bacterium]
MQAASPSSKRLFIGTSLLSLLFLVPMLVACSAGTSGTSPSSTATSSATANGTPGVPSGVQRCPGDTGNPAHWEAIVNPYAYGGQHHVESVSCAHIMGTPSLQALVTVRRADSDDTLDIFVFNNITNARPAKVFQTYGLVKGEAKISGYNTVMTAQADELSALNAGKPVSAMTADFFREFKWSANAGTLVQTAFPGIFPDLTRYQAEADQVSVNQGHQPWKLSATMVADALVASLLNWSPSSPTTLLSGGGAHDASAVLRVRSTEAVSGTIKVTLSRLEDNTNGGIWEVVSVTVDGMSLTSPVQLSVLSSPVSVKGTGNAFEGRIGQVIVLDHLYNVIGKASAIGLIGEGPTSFSTSLDYQSTFPAGIQEGVLVLYTPSNANGSIAAAVMEKVLVNGALERAFQVLSVDLVVTPNSIAGMACGSQVTFTYTATFHVPAGTAGGTIKFLYTWNNGRASPSASVIVPPEQSTAIYTFTTPGTLYADHTFPGIAEVLVTSPNAVNSPQVIPAGKCS